MGVEESLTINVGEDSDLEEDDFVGVRVLTPLDVVAAPANQNDGNEALLSHPLQERPRSRSPRVGDASARLGAEEEPLSGADEVCALSGCACVSEWMSE